MKKLCLYGTPYPEVKSYHDMIDASENRINLLAAGHFYTENPVCHVLKEVIIGAEAEIECDVFFSGNISAV